MSDIIFIGNSIRFDSVLWTPARISTALWLDAADSSTVALASGLVSQLNDKSGNSRNCSQSNATQRPTYVSSALNNLNGMSFDGGDVLLGTGQITSPAYGFFIVCSFANNTSRYIAADIGNYSAATGANSCAIEQNTFASAGQRYGAYITSGAYDSSCQTRTGPVMILITSNAVSGSNTASNTSYYVDGTQYSVSLRAGVATYGTIGQGYAMGSFNNNTGSRLNGFIYECVAIPSLASSTTIDNLFGYAAHKWGLTARLPAGHLYKTNPPYV